MPEITFIVDDLRGAMLVEDNQDLSQNAIEHLREHLGESQEIGCARPLEVSKPIADSFDDAPENSSVRIAGYYHDSLTEGPGRRSSVLFQFCPLKCKGCYVPNLHDKNAGELIPVDKLTELLLDPKFERDGVTILGGEPFAQPEGLNALERDYRAQTGIDLPFSPDTIKKRGTRLAVALDTSGSIDGELLGRFTAEIASMCAYNHCNLVLLIGDAEVHQIIEIDWRDVSSKLSRIRYTGGGGTDFRPLIKAAAEFEPDALVYLTDLYGETGDELDFPIIWATHGIAGNAPWGEQIKLK